MPLAKVQEEIEERKCPSNQIKISETDEADSLIREDNDAIMSSASFSTDDNIQTRFLKKKDSLMNQNLIHNQTIKMSNPNPQIANVNKFNQTANQMSLSKMKQAVFANKDDIMSLRSEDIGKDFNRILDP